jgi:hypothetical protein
MKRNAIYFFICLMSTAFALQSAAQDVPWFESGNEWYFSTACYPTGPCGYSHYTLDGVVEIAGHEASVVTVSTYDVSGEVTDSFSYYFRASGDSVFHLYEPTETWYLLYSFNTLVGETWTVQDDVFVGYGVEDDLENWPFIVMVDSIKTIEIGGLDRRVVYANPSVGGFSFEYGIVEGIGAVGSNLFGELPTILPGTPALFSCFIDNEEIIYGPFGYPCNILSTTENDPGPLEIFPNPAMDRISIVLPENSQPFFELRIYDLAGRLVHSGLHYQTDQSIVLPDFSSGMYILQVRSGDGIFSGKLMVE